MPRRSSGLLRKAVSWSLVLMIWGALATGGIVAYYAYDLPDIDQVEGISRAASVKLTASDGREIATFGGRFGKPVQLEELPPDLPRAVIAIEDRRFYDHPGIDVRGILRAMLRNLSEGRIVQGGSTITQQLAKNLFLTPERNLKRKVQEVLLALWLERRFTKDQILTIYLNRVYLGSGTYGVDAAARHYFGKSAKEVSLYEAALLAGLLKAPSRINPQHDQDRSEARTAQVLAAMQDVGFIDEARRKAALSTKSRRYAVALSPAPFFADWVMAQLRGYMGEVNRDLIVRTTLDSEIQAIAEEELARVLSEQGQERAANEAALVVLGPEGQVRAMVGGRDYASSQFNRATQALRQPGSAFKPIVYLTALEQGLVHPDSEVLDAPVELSGWSPKNFGDRYYGAVTLRESLARSMNSVSVRLVQKVGPSEVAKTAERLGITADLALNGSLALGASEVTLLDLTSAYATFASGGRGVWPFGIEEIASSNGDVFYSRLEGSGPGRVVSPRHAGQMVDMMRAVVVWGSGKNANPGRPAAGKTGTSQDFRDAWFVGFTGQVTAGVWFGNDDNAPMAGVTGGSLPALVWGRVMRRSLAGETALPLIADISIEEPAAAGEKSGGGFFERLIATLQDEEGDRSDDQAEDERLNRFFQRRDDKR
ncbi:MAG: PBP1A family penicillin-binding protein [Kiloniellales bacterium]|nr:PBP1A family penicillin-binding protein [Kiloniellales bacterium]